MLSFSVFAGARSTFTPRISASRFSSLTISGWENRFEPPNSAIKSTSDCADESPRATDPKIDRRTIPGFQLLFVLAKFGDDLDLSISQILPYILAHINKRRREGVNSILIPMPFTSISKDAKPCVLIVLSGGLPS
jgi:hypothetical protein